LSVISCVFSALCKRYACIRRSDVILTLGYLCAKFCLCRCLYYWASQWRTIIYNQSINHSHTAYL